MLRYNVIFSEKPTSSRVTVQIILTFIKIQRYRYVKYK